MPFNYDDFKAGRVIIAIHKECTRRFFPASGEPIIFGIEIISIEILFQSQTDDSDIGAIIMIELRTNNPQAVINIIEILNEEQCVVFAEPDFYLQPHIIPNDQYYQYLWGVQKIDCPSAWNYTTGSSDIIVGVTDSGINYNHPDIKDNMWIAPRGQGIHGRDFETDSDNPFDFTGHGSHVAGTIGAVGNNLIGITGVCWNVKLAALKIGGTVFNLAAAVKAIDYANRNRIPILNNSWGSRFFSASLKYAIDHYNGLFIVSAGNSGSDNDTNPVYPASLNSANIITVAASNRNDALASFSNYGAGSVDIAAPGTDILSTSYYGEYSYMDGTSMAAPHVAGAAALLKAYRPELTPLEMKNIILSSVDRKPQFYGRVLTGGTINISKMFDAIF